MRENEQNHPFHRAYWHLRAIFIPGRPKPRTTSVQAFLETKRSACGTPTLGNLIYRGRYLGGPR